MTVTSTITRKDYTLDGVVLIYPYDFKIFSATDLEVKKLSIAGIETTLTLTTDYSVTGAGTENGGNVVLVSAGTNGETLVIRRNIPLTQPTSFRNQRDFFAERHEDAYDRATMQIQQTTEETTRTVKVPVSFVGDATVVNLIPGYALGINALGTGVECVPNTGADQTADLANYALATRGAGMVGYAPSLNYDSGTVGRALAGIVTQDAQGFTTAGTSPNYVLTPTSPASAYISSLRYNVTFHSAATGSSTINISGLGAISLKQYNSVGVKTDAIIKAGMVADIVFDGTHFLVLDPLPLASSGRLLSTTYYLTAGTFTYTKATNNPSFIRVRMVGGGGSSGRKDTGYTGAGAGGGYSEKTIQASDLNATETIVIGAGGIAVTVNGTGNNGGTTSFGAHCSATGGSGGTDTYNTPTSGGTGIGGNLNAAGDGRSGSQFPGGSSAFSAGVIGAAGILGSGGASGNAVSFAGGPGAMIIEEYT